MSPSSVANASVPPNGAGSVADASVELPTKTEDVARTNFTMEECSVYNLYQIDRLMKDGSVPDEVSQDLEDCRTGLGRYLVALKMGHTNKYARKSHQAFGKTNDRNDDTARKSSSRHPKAYSTERGKATASSSKSHAPGVHPLLKCVCDEVKAKYPQLTEAKSWYTENEILASLYKDFMPTMVDPATLAASRLEAAKSAEEARALLPEPTKTLTQDGAMLINEYRAQSGKSTKNTKALYGLWSRACPKYNSGLYSKSRQYKLTEGQRNKLYTETCGESAKLTQTLSKNWSRGGMNETDIQDKLAGLPGDWSGQKISDKAFHEAMTWLEDQKGLRRDIRFSAFTKGATIDEPRPDAITESGVAQSGVIVGAREQAAIVPRESNDPIVDSDGSEGGIKVTSEMLRLYENDEREVGGADADDKDNQNTYEAFTDEEGEQDSSDGESDDSHLGTKLLKSARRKPTNAASEIDESGEEA